LHPSAGYKPASIHPSAWKGNSPKFTACREFGEGGVPRDVHRGFIAAGYGNGGVGLYLL
jgi:hypothetical protein